ncbi:MULTISPECIES: hypothetical protein [Streptomyces]|uniref:hypothetical protein n=1 Tax=Streptomyces TaxID=1883 RepID=UPI000E67847F|nr:MULTISPECIES: hypothetical protein [Streptomyces]MDX3065573.1 hypothetical protein [Streptomyces sp. ND04-05B]MDX3519517.1 hypothetical protein [Streptomyces scabiei]
MSTEIKISEYSRAADQALTQTRAWETLAAYATQTPDLAEALAAIDLTDLDGSLNGTAIELGLSEARKEFERNQALAEVETRRLAAGVAPNGRCTCGHLGPVHARRVVDGRLPCGIAGCRCEDLTFGS